MARRSVGSVRRPRTRAKREPRPIEGSGGAADPGGSADSAARGDEDAVGDADGGSERSNVFNAMTMGTVPDQGVGTAAKSASIMASGAMSSARAS